MTEVKNREQLFIVISQTGTLLSRILKRITGAEYNHVSLSLKPDLQVMYSFGRKLSYCPFWGGFVIESPNWGTFKRFSKTKVIVLSLDIDKEKHSDILKLMEQMHLHKNKYGYNYIGLVLAGFKICRGYNNRFYCSEFVRYVLQKFNIDGADKLEGIVQPMHFLDIPYTNKIYCGRLSEYSHSEQAL